MKFEMIDCVKHIAKALSQNPKFVQATHSTLLEIIAKCIGFNSFYALRQTARSTFSFNYDVAHKLLMPYFRGLGDVLDEFLAMLLASPPYFLEKQLLCGGIPLDELINNDRAILEYPFRYCNYFNEAMHHITIRNIDCNYNGRFWGTREYGILDFDGMSCDLVTGFSAYSMRSTIENAQISLNSFLEKSAQADRVPVVLQLAWLEEMVPMFLDTDQYFLLNLPNQWVIHKQELEKIALHKIAARPTRISTMLLLDEITSR